jgi:peptidyl-prolyl cis-trans isomerase B (cyclophilin B)
MRLTPSSTVVLAVVVTALAGCGGDGDGGATEQAGQTSSTSNGCTSATPHAHPNGGYERGKLRLNPAKTYALVFRTNCGSFTVTLSPKTAPKTAASLVSLARRGFFTDTYFHRIVPGFVIQGGDPTGGGSGGPGYKTVDKPPKNARYTHGVFAMAKSSAEPPGTSGSQFFVVTAADAQLRPEYAIVGKVTKGIDVVDRIGKLGDPTTEQPTQPVVISRVRVVVS